MAFRIQRGLVIGQGVPLSSRHAHALGHYSFSIDFPNYDWSGDLHLGEEMAEWTKAQLDRIDEVLKADSDRADLPGYGMLREGASWEIVGPGSRELDEETGRPKWNEVSRIFSSNVRLYHLAIEEVISRVRAYGNGAVHAAKGEPETKPFYMLMRQFNWRIVTTNIAQFPTALALFTAEEKDRRRSIYRKRLETIEKNKRVAAAKKGWKTRELRKRIARRIAENDERGFIELMYTEFKRLSAEYEKGKVRRAKSKKSSKRTFRHERKSKGKQSKRTRSTKVRSAMVKKPKARKSRRK